MATTDEASVTVKEEDVAFGNERHAGSRAWNELLASEFRLLCKNNFEATAAPTKKRRLDLVRACININQDRAFWIILGPGMARQATETEILSKSDKKLLNLQTKFRKNQQTEQLQTRQQAEHLHEADHLNAKQLQEVQLQGEQLLDEQAQEEQLQNEQRPDEQIHGEQRQTNQRQTEHPEADQLDQANGDKEMPHVVAQQRGPCDALLEELGKVDAPYDVDWSRVKTVVQSHPGLCRQKYLFKWKNGSSKQLTPLNVAGCLFPPLDAYTMIYEAWPEAMFVHEDGKNSSPLVYAVAGRASLEIVDFVLSVYSKAVTIQDKDGDTPLHMAAAYGAPPDVLQRLCEVSREVGVAAMKNNNGDTALHKACSTRSRTGSYGEAPYASLRSVQIICEAYPDGIRDRNSDNELPLHTACAKLAPLDIIQFLVVNYPEGVQETDSSGRLPLHLAASFHTDPPVVSYIHLEFKNASKISDDTGSFPLHCACFGKQPIAVVQKIYEDYPEALSSENSNGQYPLDIAVKGHTRRNVIDFLERINAPGKLDETSTTEGMDLAPFVEEVIESPNHKQDPFSKGRKEAMGTSPRSRMSMTQDDDFSLSSLPSLPSVVERQIFAEKNPQFSLLEEDEVDDGETH